MRIETPDREFDHYINHWQSRRSLMLARTIRYNYAPQGRNVIQDAMGGAYVRSSSRDWFLRIWGHQHTNGWLPHGMPFAEGVQQIEINSIPHKDINSWGPTSLAFYMYETGDFGILAEWGPVRGRPGSRRRRSMTTSISASNGCWRTVHARVVSYRAGRLERSPQHGRSR